MSPPPSACAPHGAVLLAQQASSQPDTSDQLNPPPCPSPTRGEGTGGEAPAKQLCRYRGESRNAVTRPPRHAAISAMELNGMRAANSSLPPCGGGMGRGVA